MSKSKGNSNPQEAEVSEQLEEKIRKGVQAVTKLKLLTD